MDNQLKDPPVTADEAAQVCLIAISCCTIAAMYTNEDESLRFYGMVSLFNEIYRELTLLEWLIANAAIKEPCNVMGRIGNN